MTRKPQSSVDGETNGTQLLVESLWPLRWREVGHVGCVIATVGAQIVGTLLIVPRAPSQGYPVFEAIFAGTAFWLGRRAGVAAVGLSALLLAYFVLPGAGFAVNDPDDALGLVAFVAGGLFIVSVVSHLTTRVKTNQVHLSQLARQGQENAGALLQELSHRIGNDLNVLTCVAELQALRAEHDETRNALRSIAERTEIFGQLYRRLSLDVAKQAAFDCGDFLADLCADLRAAHLTLRPISLEITADRCEINANRAMLVGLVMNEAVVNAIKYAFPDDRVGLIDVAFIRQAADPTQYELTIADDGVGLGDAADPGGTGMGQRLLHAIAAQLNGSYSLQPRERGVVVRLRFASVDQQNVGASLLRKP